MTIDKNKDKVNYPAAVHNAKKDFEVETTLSYKNSDGSRGWIVRIRPKNGKGSSV